MSIELKALPDGWAIANLNDIADWGSGGTPKRSVSNYYSGSIPWVTIADLNNDVVLETRNYITDLGVEESAARLVPEKTVLLALYGSIGKLGIAGKELTTNQAIATAIPNELWIDNKYLFHYLESQKQFLNQLGSGVTQKKIYLKDVKTYPIQLAPRNEQTRIVGKLEELLSDLDSGVAELKATQKKLNQYRQTLLKSAVEGTLTEKWRSANRSKISETGEQLLQRILKERRQRWEDKKQAEFKAKGKKPPKDWQQKYPEPVQPDISGLPELPEGWVWASVDQCTLGPRDITDGPFGSNLKTSHYTDSGPRVIRLQNIGDGVFNDDKAYISEEHYQNLLKHSFETGDTLVAMMGEVLPRACLIPEGITPGIVKADCARVRLNSEILKPELLPNYLNSQTVRLRTKSLVKGVGRPRINLSHIRGAPVPIASLQEQVSILHALKAEEESIDQRASEVQLALIQSDAQRKNILKDAFSGKLVAQNPNDESASVLLEKIRAEREVQASLPKPKRPQKKASNKASIMKTLLEVLNSQTDWMDAQEVFKACGVSDGTDTDRIEELYAELRRLDKEENVLDIRRVGNFDQIRLKEKAK